MSTCAPRSAASAAPPSAPGSTQPRAKVRCARLYARASQRKAAQRLAKRQGPTLLTALRCPSAQLLPASAGVGSKRRDVPFEAPEAAKVPRHDASEAAAPDMAAQLPRAGAAAVVAVDVGDNDATVLAEKPDSFTGGAARGAGAAALLHKAGSAVTSGGSVVTLDQSGVDAIDAAEGDAAAADDERSDEEEDVPDQVLLEYKHQLESHVQVRQRFGACTRSCICRRARRSVLSRHGCDALRVCAVLAALTEHCSPSQTSVSTGHFITKVGLDFGFDLDFIKQKLPIKKKAFGADWDKGLLGLNKFINGQMHYDVPKRYMYDDRVAAWRTKPAGTWEASTAQLFDDMQAMAMVIAGALNMTLDAKPNACAMLSAIPAKLLGGKLTKVTDHVDSLAEAVINGKVCKRVKIMMFGGGEDMKRDLVLIHMGLVIGGVAVEASDVVISSDAFLQRNGLGPGNKDLLHSSRLRGGGPSALLTSYAYLPNDTPVAELLNALELPPAMCIPATAATLRVLLKTDYPHSRHILGPYSRRFIYGGRVVVGEIEGFTEAFVRNVMKPFLAAVDFDKELIGGAWRRGSPKKARWVVRRLLCPLVSWFHFPRWLIIRLCVRAYSRCSSTRSAAVTCLAGSSAPTTATRSPPFTSWS